jgi:hypothetical protein
MRHEDAMNRLATTIVIAISLVVVGWSLGHAQAAHEQPDFKLNVAQDAKGSIVVRCLEGCDLVVDTHMPGGERLWRVHTTFNFNCNSGQVCS